MGRILYFIFSLSFFLGGIFLIYWGSIQYQKAKDSESWPTVQGKVIESELIESVGSTKSGKHRRKTTSYKPKIIFSYVVKDNNFTNDKISFSPYGSDYEGAKIAIDTYPKDKPVIVYYNSNDPQESVLETGINNLTYMPIVGGFLFSLAPLLIFILKKNSN